MVAMSAERLTVLLAEDDQKDVMMINLALERDGIPAEFHLVNDGEQVVEYLAGTGLFRNRNRYPFPDLVIVDLKMARMGGMDIVKWLRKDFGVFPDARRDPERVWTDGRCEGSLPGRREQLFSEAGEC